MPSLLQHVGDNLELVSGQDLGFHWVERKQQD